MSKKVAQPLVKSMLLAISSLPISEAMGMSGWQRNADINVGSDKDINAELKESIKRTLSERESIKLINDSIEQLLLFSDGDKKLKERIIDDLEKMGLSARYDNGNIKGTDYFVRPRPTAMWGHQNLSGFTLAPPEIKCHGACHSACHGSRGWR